MRLSVLLDLCLISMLSCLCLSQIRCSSVYSSLRTSGLKGGLKWQCNVTTSEAAWFIISVDSVCMYVCLYVCPSDDSFQALT